MNTIFVPNVDLKSLRGQRFFRIRRLPTLGGTEYRNIRWRKFSEWQTEVENGRTNRSFEIDYNSFRPERISHHHRSLPWIFHYPDRNSGELITGADIRDCPFNEIQPYREILIPRGWASKVFDLIRNGVVGFITHERVRFADGHHGLFLGYQLHLHNLSRVRRERAA